MNLNNNIVFDKNIKNVWIIFNMFIKNCIIFILNFSKYIIIVLSLKNILLFYFINVFISLIVGRILVLDCSLFNRLVRN